ncbi:NADH:flavin oxidoreductase/NADH oxidase family protein [Pendulispora albinea]|uniref:NADH:flavin oxidoreductase/NADH oxidase family protein n=1 Tax=Pendulispora albinea TaxID=2741071 RepID=A0ABZ2LRQ0_9BACT
MQNLEAEITPGAPLVLKCGATLKNRIAKSAMSEQLAGDAHDPSEGLARLYRRWAEGGASLSITGNVMVDRDHLVERRNVVLDAASDTAAFDRWTRAGTRHGTHLWAQLNHPGKQTPSTLTWEPVAPSSIALKNGLRLGFNRPRALSNGEVLDIIDKFAHSAKLARQVGFTGVQIQGAHGFLVSQFLSPAHNQRGDRWGGSLGNRMRFVLEVYHAVRAAVGNDFPVAIKLNSSDFTAGGLTEMDSMDIAFALAKAGIDAIEVSGGTFESPAMAGLYADKGARRREGYFLGYAESVRPRVDTALMVTGGFRSGAGIARALRRGAADLVGLSRPMVVEPSFPRNVLAHPEHRIDFRERSTGIKALDRLALLDTTWYEHQLARIAHDQPPSHHLSAWRSVMTSFFDMGLHALAQRRV